ncbi:tRNA (adenosine(37)-N6)-dimethylallyltransferase MiaA [Amphibacillus cookii]|uniref:tRNA (adenosine(37)-N6)-dimethylallyltransferase MiaA n=1 Tax=Amphibacillus cookii TaxID=767787 RepID=UPI001958E35C|nr:tRNA (adenosine(37)-N6)-dimethylallyltransferase MiaA [Amphibacillus cookii]MBM7540648.1 tRNA dimethylallyltransferase [Amphibacillus cookii]
MKQPVVAIVGPTAVGKTELSVQIAQRFDGEVISGDSMQIYRGMEIATAKVTEEEKAGIPHHMLDIKDPEESFSVAEFQEKVQHYITMITDKGRLPIIAGGTGLYIDAALSDYQFSEQRRDPSYQAKIEASIEQDGIDHVYARLQSIDPIQAAKIHPNNVRRIVRALEVYDRTGQTMSEMQAQQSQTSPYHPILIGLEMDRTLLYQRINERIDHMLTLGLIEEAHYFYKQGLENAQSMKAIGYKEFIPYFKGDCDLDEAILLLKRHSRRYAKRQYTWFKNKMKVNWYNLTPETKEQVFEKIYSDLAGILSLT